jgi:hypothetical protein
METKYGMNITNKAISEELHRLTNQIYKLLPTREEGGDWLKLLETITLEITGMDSLLLGMHDKLFPLMCKLEALAVLGEELNFMTYRKTVFECLSLIGDMINNVRI